MQSPTIYSLKEVTCSFFGVEFGGKGQASDGDFIKITYPNKYVTLQKGSDGSTVYSENPNAWDAEVEINMSQTSQVWAILSGALQSLRLSGGVLTGPGLVKDNGGSLVFSCPVAAPDGLPGVTFGLESGSRTLKVLCPNSVEIGGGN